MGKYRKMYLWGAETERWGRGYAWDLASRDRALENGVFVLACNRCGQERDAFYGGEDTPDDISRGLFAGEVDIPRLLQLFKKNNITATWFSPGHSIPDQMKMIVDAGHEIGAHGYSHENPIAMTRSRRRTSWSRAWS